MSIHVLSSHPVVDASMFAFHLLRDALIRFLHTLRFPVVIVRLLPPGSHCILPGLSSRFSLFTSLFGIYIYFISSSIRWMGTILETIYLRYSNWHCLICTRYLLYLFTLLKDSFALCTNSSLFLALIKMLRSSANPIKFAHFVNYSFRTFVVKVIPQGRP